MGVNVARSAIGLGMRVEALDPYASPSLAESVGVTLRNNLPEVSNALARLSWFLNLIILLHFSFWPLQTGLLYIHL